MSASIFVRRPRRTAQLEEGTYDATIEGVEELTGVMTPWGEQDKILVTFDVNGVVLRRRYNKSLYPTSNLFVLINELTGEPGEEFDVVTLVDMPCRVLISHRETDTGDVWENIEKVTKSGKSAPSTLVGNDRFRQ
jgi:hypothetical protein